MLKINLLSGGKQQATYGQGDMTGKDPEQVLNDIVGAAVAHAGSLIKGRADNKHIADVTINIHYH